MSKRVLYREYDDNGNLIKLECSKCGEIKSVDNFNKNKSGKDGFDNKCKECCSIYRKNHYLKNKDKTLIKSHEYYINNKEKVNERQHQYNIKNKQKILDYHHQYYETNKDNINEKRRQHYQENKEKIIKRQLQYYETNKDNINEKRYQHYQNNKQNILEKQRIYRKNNKEKIKEYSRLYRINNKEKIVERSKKYIEQNKEKLLEYQKNFYNDKVNQAMIEIYENFTKNNYPNKDIQYGIIYGVHCISSDRWYIGQTVRSFNIRYDGDFLNCKNRELTEDSQKGKILQNDIEKYGQENFEIFEVIDVAFSEKELDEKEAYYIDLYKAYDDGYNSNRGNIFKHNKLKRKEVI